MCIGPICTHTYICIMSIFIFRIMCTRNLLIIKINYNYIEIIKTLSL